MSTVVAFNTQRRKNGQPLMRFDLRTYSTEDLLDLREAYQALYDLSEASPTDPRGYWGVARGHGYDQELCHTNPADFLTWHRAYVYMFERRLIRAFQRVRQDDTLMITLPYWDWTRTVPRADAANGLPKAVNDPTYTLLDGTTRPNPLYRAKSLYRTQFRGLNGDAAYTERAPNILDRIPWLEQQVAMCMRIRRYTDFNGRLEGGAHNAVHFLVSGDMGQVVSAAFDPVFWLHHCMVDKVWYDWQRLHSDHTVPASVRQATLYGGLTGAQVLDAEGSLLYGYSRAGLGVPRSDGNTLAGVAALEPTMEFQLGAIERGFDSATLDFQGLKPPSKSYELRVFINPKDAVDRNTPLDDDAYAGSLFLFGHGPCIGASGHCNPNLEPRGPYDLRSPHHYSRRNCTLDITDALKKAIRGLRTGRKRSITAAFVVLDDSGAQVDPNALDFDAIALIAR